MDGSVYGMPVFQKSHHPIAHAGVAKDLLYHQLRRLSGAYWAERQPYMTINADKKTDQVFRYEMKVPYESWMAGATLVLRQVQTSPGGVRRVFTVDVNGAVDVSRK